MANNSYDPTANRAEQIRKAKGNPNRNNHTKKKNSNYGGYAAAEKKAEPTVSRDSRRLKLTKTQKTAFLADLIILGILLLLQYVVFPGNTLLPVVTTLMLGFTCGMLYLFRQTSDLNRTTSFKIIQTLLAVIAVFYIVIGAAGVFSFIKSLG